MLVGWHVSSGQRQLVSNNCHVLSRMIKVGPEPLENKSTNRLLDPFFELVQNTANPTFELGGHFHVAVVACKLPLAKLRSTTWTAAPFSRQCY